MLPLLRCGLKRLRVSQVTRGPSDKQRKPCAFFSQHHKANHLLTHPILHFSESVDWLTRFHMIFTRLNKLFLRQLYQAPIITFLMSCAKFTDLNRFKRSVAYYCQCCQPKSMTMSNWLCCQCFALSEVKHFFHYHQCYLYNFLVQKEGKEHKKLLGV